VKRCLSTLIAAAGCWGEAAASVVEELTPEALSLQSDAVVEGRVLNVHSRWNTNHTGLETSVQFRVDTRISGSTEETIVIEHPGGELDGQRHLIVGMPKFVVGEEARLFLRALPDAVVSPRYRVYGWDQGKWSKDRLEGVSPKRPTAGTSPFTLNGFTWPAAKIPVQYKVNSVGSDDLTLDAIKGAIAAGFATWDVLPCSALSYAYSGETALGMAVDDENVMLFIESGWVYGEEAAAATSIFGLDGMQTADIAMNGQRFTWAIGPSGSSAATTLDLQGVLTHEMGHFSGLSHTQSAHDTMYYSWKPWPGQRTISLDDKLGICSIYPIQGDECGEDAGCPEDETCRPGTLGSLCGGTPSPIGTPCNYDVVECEDFCLFTSSNLSTGYCSKYCMLDEDCPSTHRCMPASAGSAEVKACFVRLGPPPDAGIPDAAGPADAAMDIPDAATGDASVGCGLCRRGSYCDERAQRCTFDCRTNADCGGDNFCNGDGRCESEPAEAEPEPTCACSGTRQASGSAGLAALLLLRTRRRR